MYTTGGVGKRTEATVQVKKVLTIGGIAFVAYYLLARPSDAAQTVKETFDTMTTAADSLARFVNRLS
jgi:arginine exporter protein ArgO